MENIVTKHAALDVYLAVTNTPESACVNLDGRVIDVKIAVLIIMVRIVIINVARIVCMEHAIETTEHAKMVANAAL